MLFLAESKLSVETSRWHFRGEKIERLQGLEISSEHFCFVGVDSAGAQVELNQYLRTKKVIFKTARTRLRSASIANTSEFDY